MAVVKQGLNHARKSCDKQRDMSMESTGWPNWADKQL